MRYLDFGYGATLVVVTFLGLAMVVALGSFYLKFVLGQELTK